MHEDNLALPHKNTPLSPYHYPKTNSDSVISELFHGNWWTSTRLAQCDEDNCEILVPIILYMDGIVVDQNGRLTLTPLTFTLGTFKTEVRAKTDAWETLYFHPDSEYVQSTQTCKATPIESLKDFTLL